jgi:hypothetical protein
MSKGGGRPETRASRRCRFEGRRLAVATLSVLVAVSSAAFAAPVPAPGDILVVDRSASGGTLFLVKRQTGAVSVVSAGGNFGDPRRLAVADDGTLFVADADPNAGKIVRVDPRDGSQTLGVGNLPMLTGIALANATFAFVTQLQSSFPVVRVNLTDGSTTALDSGIIAPSDLALEKAGTLLVVDTGTGNGEVWRIDPVADTETELNLGVARPQAIALEPDGAIILAGGSAATAAVFRVGPGTKGATPVATGGRLVMPMGVAVASFGTIFVADPGAIAGGTAGTPAVVAIDPQTGAQTTIASGSPFMNPHGIAVVTSSSPVCGNGVIDPGEDCDQGDGNGGTAACCGLDCRLLVASVSCPAATSFCGTQANGVSCSPDDPCVTGATCRDGACGGGTTICAAEVVQRTPQRIRVDCTVNGDPRQPCVAQGFLAPPALPADTVGPVPLAGCSAAGATATAVVERRTNRRNRARFNVTLRACARRQLRASGSLDVSMVMRMGDGADQRTVMRRLRLLKKRSAS